MKKFFISLILASLILLNCISYCSSYKFTATADKTTVNPGDEVYISLKVSDINACSDGINVVETTLLYDTSVFEKFEFVEKNNWKVTYNSNQGDRYGKLLYTKMITGVTDDEEIGILKFKLKDDLKEMETEIKLLQVTSNDGYELMNEGDRIITLKIKKETAPIQPDEPTPDEPAPDEPTPNKPEKPSVPSEPTDTPAKDEEDTGTVMGVQTGDLVGIVVFILLLIIIINLIIFIYTRQKKSISPDNNTNDSNKDSDINSNN